MTIRAIAGLVGLNAFLFAVGGALLWGIRGWASWREPLRLAGVAYLLGVAALFCALTVEVVVGIPIGLGTIVVTGLVSAGCGLVLGRLRSGHGPEQERALTMPRLTPLGAVSVALILVYLEGVFRQGRLAWLYEWDAWRVWTIRAKEIYFTGGFGPELADPSLIGSVVSAPSYPSYPPGISGLQASAFFAMGSPDVVTLHLEHWFLLVGFAAALFGLLAPLVRPAFLLPFVLLLLLMPSLTERATWAHADLAMDYLVAIAALLLFFWLEDRHEWRLPTATLLMAGALVTKREGLLLVASVVVAAIAASWADRRWAWPRLLGALLVALVPLAMWRIWLGVHGLPSGSPTGGLFGFLDHVDRAWPSTKLVLRTVFDYDLWLLVPVLVFVAVTLGLFLGMRRLALFVATFLGASIAACIWTIWANLYFAFSQGEGESPVVRQVGGVVLVAASFTPLLLERVWASRDGPRQNVPARERSLAHAVLPWAIVLIPVLAYPGSMAVGYSGFRLPGGKPPFPTASECVHAPKPRQRVGVVLGYRGSYVAANQLRGDAVAAGLGHIKVAQDGCGRLRVFVDDVRPAAVAGVVARAEAAGFRTRLELDPDG
jgi:hypothetical protein